MSFPVAQSIDPPPVVNEEPFRLLWPTTLVKLATGYEYLLFFRFVILNGCLGALATAVAIQGWLNDMFRTDDQHLVKLIVAVFLLGFAMCAQRIFRLSQELNAAREVHPCKGTRAHEYLRHIAGGDGQTRSTISGLLKMKLASRLEGIRYIANLLVLLGLIGTVIGFIIALGGIDPSRVGNAEAIAPMVANLLQGMAVALYTTLAGSLLNIWLMLNFRLLTAGTTRLFTQIVERGEHHE